MVRYTVLIVLVCALPLGCIPPPPPAPPVARSFVYTPPEQAKQMLPVTIAIVRPRYEDPARMTGLSRDTRDAFVQSLKTDLEKLLVAKGFKVSGPYDSLDVMTFPEKQGANLTLTPIIDIRTDDQETRNSPPLGILFPGDQEGRFVVGGWVALVMLEPMSGEKMWVKRVEVEPVQESYRLTYIEEARNNQKIKKIQSDTRPQALTVALNRIYPEVLQKAWTYFHPEEVMSVKRQADEVRKLKRY